MAAAITREGKRGEVTDRPLDNLEQPRSALAATCSVICVSRSKEKKEKKGMGMMKDRGGRRQ